MFLRTFGKLIIFLKIASNLGQGLGHSQPNAFVHNKYTLFYKNNYIGTTSLDFRQKYPTISQVNGLIYTIVFAKGVFVGKLGGKIQFSQQHI